MFNAFFAVNIFLLFASLAQYNVLALFGLQDTVEATVATRQYAITQQKSRNKLQCKTAKLRSHLQYTAARHDLVASSACIRSDVGQNERNGTTIFPLPTIKRVKSAWNQTLVSLVCL